MKHLFNAVNIKTRLFVLVVIPLLVTILLSGERLSHALDSQEKIDNLSLVLDYAEVTYPLISASLQESFYSRLYIDTDQTAHSDYRSKLNRARERAIASQKIYQQFIADKKAQLRNFTSLYSHVELVKELLANSDHLRAATNNKQHFVPAAENQLNRDIHTMYEQTLLIRKLVLSLSEIAVLATQHEALGKQANAYYNLVAASAESSFHNNMIYTAINNQLDVYIFGEIYSGATKMHSYQELFLSFASSRARTAFNKMIENSDYKVADKIGLQARSNIYSQVNKPLAVSSSLDWEDTSSRVFDLYQQAINEVLGELIETRDNTVEEARFLVIQTTVLLITLLVVIACFAYVVSKSITAPLKNVVSALVNLAKTKDMTVKLSDTGRNEISELGSAINTLLDSFKGTLQQVKQEARNVDTSSRDVILSMQESTHLSANQLDATDSISVAINQMSATISQVAEMANNTSSVVNHAHELSINSATDAEASKQMMTKLTEELGNTSDVVNDLKVQSKDIGNVLNVIQDIAEQTNLLALNAAIEAARAGEMGRGFAVVADEVRNLAGRTQTSTAQIHEQIEKLQSGAQAATQKMLNLQTEGNSAVDMVVKGNQAFDVLRDELDQINNMATQIATASDEQTSVANVINERIIAIRDDSETISRKTNQASESASGLRETEQRLNQYINEFTFE